MKQLQTIHSILWRFIVLVLILIFFEGIITFGNAFKFEEYNWFGITIQLLLLYCCFTLAVAWYRDDR
jgi:ABC-type transport system involved in Fe-S cluster assembly fused permease/ATPase subunit